MDKLRQIYKNYHPEPNLPLLDKVFEYSEAIYMDSQRKSGQLWIDYLLELATEATKMRMDTDIIVASFLIDAYSFGLRQKDIEEEFDIPSVINVLKSFEELRRMSDLYDSSKLTSVYTDYLRTLILAASKDMRVVALRLAQKNINVKTVDFLEPTLRDTALKKALHLYSPLSELLGMGNLRSLLEKEAFSKLHPEEFAKTIQVIKNFSGTHKTDLDTHVSSLKTLMQAEGVEYKKIKGREKEAYSLYKKIKNYMNKMDISFEEASNNVNDKYAFMILVDTVEDCYKALGVINSIYSFYEEDFDDYIVNPKTNGYKAIHVITNLNEKNKVEIQIKTTEMHDYNEHGPASHMHYKLFGSQASASELKMQILKSAIKWQNENVLSNFSVPIEDLSKEILVFSPAGDLVSLPIGSTPVDYAYEIHTKLAEQTVRAEVNGKHVPLDHKLQNGDVVKLQKDINKKKPSMDWLEFVVSPRAKFYISKALRQK